MVIAADPHKRTLLDFRYQKVFKASKGGAGAGANKNGKDADDRVIPVPPGTVVTDSETGEIVADLVEPGTRVVVAAGGRGGRGNSCFATSTDRTPTRAEPGGKRWSDAVFCCAHLSTPNFSTKFHNPMNLLVKTLVFRSN